MNAHALLTSQGWRGKGHTLHQTNDAVGLSKPLLLSRKDDTKGLGNKQHFTSDQWWMNAFDEQLKGLDTSVDGKVLQTVNSGKLNSIEKKVLGKYYLYTSFVRGGSLKGTIADQGADASPPAAPEAKPTADAQEGLPPTETKKEKRARRAEKRRRKEERAKRREQRAKRKEERRERRSEAPDSGSSDAHVDDGKRRRRAKKAEKRRKRLDREAKKAKKREDRIS